MNSPCQYSRHCAQNALAKILDLIVHLFPRKKNSEGRWKIKNIHIRTKIRITKKNYFSSCLHSICTLRIYRLDTLIEQNERKKKFNGSVGICFHMSAYRQKRIQCCCCCLCRVIIWPMHIAHRGWVREKKRFHSSRLPQFLCWSEFITAHEKIFSNFPSLILSLSLSLPWLYRRRRLLKCVAQFSSFKIYRFFPSFFCAFSPLAAVSN